MATVSDALTILIQGKVEKTENIHNKTKQDIILLPLLFLLLEDELSFGLFVKSF